MVTVTVYTSFPSADAPSKSAAEENASEYAVEETVQVKLAASAPPRAHVF